ncbi:alpha-ketoacid dehydrogenase subunit beta [Nocardioides alcanivorans]|uniref:alpha-ketoacid dehydrogenase subunit beta n=1 Tax=Nocardioides alcanivorans TaxID=2897352 RepID=UPI001F325D1D|nr:transketolase C-terminal domain-containing protein [Nocardioides alcanivorans]
MANDHAVREAGESSPQTIREAVIAAIAAEMRTDSSVVLLGQDIGAFGGPLQCTAGLLDQFGGDRLVETPICESSMMSMAVGGAVSGLRPVVDLMFSDMLPLVAVPLIQTAASLRYLTDGAVEVPLVVRTRGGDGPYRSHPQNYEAIFAHSPGLTIVEPSNPRDAHGLMRSAIRSNDPVIFIENIFLYNAVREVVPLDEHLVELGRGAIVHTGDDVTVVTYGRSVRSAVQAAEMLAQDGVGVEVIDLRTLHPWDEQLVTDSVRRTGRLVVAHEAWEVGGLGAEIVARVTAECFSELRRQPARVGAPAIPIPWAPGLRDATLPTADRILEAVCEVMRG